MRDALKLTTYGGERDRSGDRFTADALIDLYARHGVRTSALLRGAAGFGAQQHLRTDRLLTLSEDLPVVSVAVDARDRIAALVPEVRRIATKGLITLERARLLGDAGHAPGPSGATKLTVYLGRQERADGRPAYASVIDTLQRHGVAGATALLGVDGTAHGVRRRARLLSRNAEVPVMVIAVGDAERIAAALAEVRAWPARPPLTLERIVVCKRDGHRLAPPHAAGDDAADPDALQKLTVYAGEQARHDGAPVYQTLIRRLRAEGAAGATAVRGFWGFHGDHAPHGDRFWALRRHVPVVTVVIDRPAAMGRWFAIADELTARSGLVTSEIVPSSGAFVV
jgi:PII-like signaling protein